MSANLYNSTSLSSPAVIEYIFGPADVLGEEAAGPVIGAIGAIVGAVGAAFHVVAGVGTALGATLGLHGTIGAIVGNAAFGAGISALTGGDPLVGAVLGGVGGAFSGGAFGGAAASSTNGTFAPNIFTAAPLASTSAPAALSAVPAYTGAAGFGVPISTLGDVSTPLASGFNATSSALAAAATKQGVGQGTLQAIGRSAVSSLASNPVGLLSAITQAAASGNTLRGYETAVAARKAELDALQGQQNGLYQQQVSMAQQMLQQAKNTDPNWYGLMSAADYKASAERQNQEAMREQSVTNGGLNGARLNATNREYRIKAAANDGLAYNQGRYTGEQLQNQQFANASSSFAGLRIPDNTAAYGALHDLTAEANAARNASDVSTFAGVANDLFGKKPAYSSGQVTDKTAFGQG